MRLPRACPGLLAPLALLMGPSTALAQYEAAWGTQGVEVRGFAGLFSPSPPDFVAGENPFRFESDPELLFGGSLGYLFPINIFIEGEVRYAPLAVEEPGGTRDVGTLFYGGSLGYNIQAARGAQFFVVAGGGAVRWNPDGLDGETHTRVHVGGGVRLFLTPSVAFRVEARDDLLPATLTGFRRDRSPGLGITDEPTHNLSLIGAISLVFGGPHDSDGDGVVDRNDACPDTPGDANVDARGCPRDGDSDGVPDFRDGCPNTKAGVGVDSAGCALDADADGVPDGVDRCPNTTAGAEVDDAGCATDRDGDGVADGVDRCPNTLGGATVDETGCARDGDADGVADGLDLCPNTPPDREVNTNGCSRIEAGLEAGRLVLHNVYFAFGKATLRDDSRPVLDEVARALADRPALVIEVQGHTDSVGPAAYNQKLSEQRAQAVASYLLTFPGLDRGRFVVRGYGEGKPIAPNETATGRQENRRVEFVVLRR